MMRASTCRSLQLRCLWTVLLVAMLGSTAWAKPKIAILGIEAIGTLDPQLTDVAKDLTYELRTRAARGNFTPSSSKRELVDEKLMGNCATEALGCMAVISNNLGADYLLYGHLEKTNDGYHVTLWLLRVNKSGSISGSSEGTVSEPRAAKDMTGPALAKWVDATYAKLTGEKIESANGKLIVKVGNAVIGTVFIDGEDKGQLEDGKLAISLPEGTYKLAIDADGYKRYEEPGIEVKSGATRDVDVELATTDTPPPPRKSRKKLFLGLGIGALAVSATGGGFWIYDYVARIRKYENGTAALDEMGKTLNSDRCDYKGTITGNQSGFKSACDARGRTYWDITVTSVFAAAGFGLLAYAWLSDSPGETSSRITRRRPARGEVAITPMITPQTSGAQLRIDW